MVAGQSPLKANKTVQRTEASQLAQRQIEPQKRLAPIADLCVKHRMHITRFFLTIGAFVALLAAGCARTASKPRMAEQDVVRVAKSEMFARFSDSVAAHEPYHAE